MPTFLHIGCGPKRQPQTTRGFNTSDWREIRLDSVYGHRPAMARGNVHMAHRCGFTQKVLSGTLQASGFASVATMARGRAPFFDLWALASKCECPQAQMRKLAGLHFPV